MDTRRTLLAALLAAASSVAPLVAHADPDASPAQPDDDRRARCARMRAYPSWCREDAARRAEERERVQRVERERER